MVKVVVVAGTHSGVGKTSLSVGLMLALRQMGHIVQPFKVGPDFLDPLHHVAACGRPSINLDGWMLNKQQVLDTFHRHSADADVAVVEGVMGLYDSRDGASDDGSTAQIAKWLGAPVVLVVDCWAMARSAAALVKGYAEFDPDLQLCGVLLNKVGGTGHGVWLKQALTAARQQQRLQKEVKVLGCIPKDDLVSVPERYLGLTMPHEQDSSKQPTDSTTAAPDQQPTSGEQSAVNGFTPPVPPYLSRLAQHVSKHVDLAKLLEVAATVQSPSHDKQQQAHPTLQPSQQQPLPAQQQQQPGHSGDCALISHRIQLQPYSCRIAVARDEAFCFYYQDNLSLLRAAGAELVFFSPLRSAHLPADIAGIYFGGGYPERHAQQLSSNSSLLSDVRQWAAAGGVVYAECGGLIYLCKGFQQSKTSQPAGTSNSTETTTNSSCSGNTENSSSSSSSSSKDDSTELIPLVRLLPFTARMGGMKMGYVEVEVLPGNPLFPAGVHARGQVYHFSEVIPCSDNANSTNSSSSTVSAKQDLGPPGDCSTNSTSSEAVGGGDQASDAAMRHTYRLQQVLPGAQLTLEGYAVGNVLASYVHLHWGGCPQLAAAFVDKCCSNTASAGSAAQLGQAGSILGERETAAAQEQGEGKVPTTCSLASSNSCCCIAAASYDTSSSSSKIVSLLPSGTEILYALGLQDRLVGVSGFCDWPPEARSKPCAVRSLIDVDTMSSDDIEAAMQAFKAAGQSPFEIDTGLLARELPGLVLTQDACRTCDADCSLVCKAMQQAGLSPDKTQVLVLHPTTLSEVFDSILTIGAAAGVADMAQQLVAQLHGRLQAVAAAVQARSPAAAAAAVAKATIAAVKICSGAAAELKIAAKQVDSTTQPANGVSAPARSNPKQQKTSDIIKPNGVCGKSQNAPRVLSLEGLNPLVLGGQWLPDVKLAAGAVDASGQQPGDPSTRITWEQVLSYAPDVLLLCPCSRSTAAAMPDVTRLTQQPGFKDLPAVRSGRVYVIDHSYFSRPGPRLVDGVELLYKLLWEDCAGAQPHPADAASIDSKQAVADSVCESGENGGGDGSSRLQCLCCDNVLEHCHKPVTAANGCASHSNGTGVGATAHEVLAIHCSSDGGIQWLPL